MMQESEPLYSAHGLVVTAQRVTLPSAAFATADISGVWVAQERPLALLYIIVGLVGLMFGGTMMSCTGLVIGAMSGDDSWQSKAWAVIAASGALLLASKSLPPSRFAVVATIGGQAITLYHTRDSSEAAAVSDAISRARGIA
jgi:hypothetical protein